MSDSFFENCGIRITLALRRIMHGVDSHSRRIFKEHGTTGPQLICLYTIVDREPVTLSELSKHLSLSASTVNGILDRLEKNEFITRERKSPDKRKVLISATQSGRDTVRRAPMPLQDKLADAISALPELEQAAIALSLERIVDLMEIERYETQPIPALDAMVQQINEDVSDEESINTTAGSVGKDRQ